MAAPSRLRFRAVLFDAGDTLIYMPRTPEEILLELCRQIGASISLEQAAEAYLASERYYSEHYLGYAGDPGEFWHRYHGEALRCLGIEDPFGEKADFLSHGFGGAGVWQPFPEAVSVCRSLRAMGFRLGVVSNGPDAVDRLLSQAGLRPFLDVVVASQSAGVEKPDPRIFEMALERLGIPARDALFVGNLYEVDVVGARTAGLAPVVIDRRDHPESRDCPVIRSLEELIPLVSGVRPYEDLYGPVT